MSRRMTRRTLVADLGRTVLGAVVLGPVLGACTAQDTPDGTAASPTDGSAGSDGARDAVATTPATWERASFGFVSGYVLVRDGEALVFDTGTGEDGVGPIGDALAAAGVGWDAVSNILVSHRHGDHAGGAEAVAAEAPGAVLHAAQPDLDRIAAGGLATAEVVDGDMVAGVRVVATPGHTSGHISGFDEASRLLLVGDALVNGVAIGGTTGDGVELSPPDFTFDAELAAASGEVLAGLDYDVALFGHGDPITVDAAATVAAAVGGA